MGYHDLDLAATCKDVTVVQFLLAHAGRIAGANPLHQAAGSSTTDYDQREMMAFLLDEVGMDINAFSTFGNHINTRRGYAKRTPLHAAVTNGEEITLFSCLIGG